LSVNFRGYGKSAGRPSEKDLFSDALEIFDTIQAQNKDRPICLIGRSLGSGVACYVASSRKIKSLILITPFDSIRSVAQGQYAIIPIGPLLKHPFDSMTYSQKITVPTLFLLAQSDVLIPRKNSLTLFEHWPSTKSKFIVPDSDHNNMLWNQFGRPKLIDYINEFIVSTEK
jgi:pimeloyl-ACP methyl ester carboxylesterase